MGEGVISRSSGTGATTSFKVTDPQDRQTNLIDIIPQLETHHGSLINNDLHFPSGFELEVIGLPLGNEVKEALRKYGFSTFSASTTGFEAKKDDCKRYRSTAIATAFPPPRHSAAIPRCTSRRIIS